MSLPLINGIKASAHSRANSQQPKRNGAGRHQTSSPPFDQNEHLNDACRSNNVSVSTAAAKRDAAEATDFRILVAARIRPFTEREVRQWWHERRALQVQEDNEETRRVRSALRQPFGPEHRSLNATQTGLDGTWTRRHEEDGGMGTNNNKNYINFHEVPPPVVEVDSNGKTVMLLDAQSLTSDATAALTTAPVRNAFTFDYVYSSFAPNVELDAQLTQGSSAGRRRNNVGGGGGVSDAGSYVIMDGDDADPETTHATSAHTASQEEQAEAQQVAIYEELAIPLVSAALHGYNACMFAYGQTGSGKTYTMMGTPRHLGLIPRLCQLLFSEVSSRNAAEDDNGNGSGHALFILHLSYMEIYNEQVRDLLKQRPKNAILHYKSRFDKKDVDSNEYRTLKVRHHPSKGIYVDGLTSVPVRTWDECKAYLQQGNALRTQCSTAMNAKSSRSHAIFQLQMTQRESTGGRVRGKEVALETFSKINLVDLAGSERNTQTKSTGKHLAEANSINASLSTLRRVLDGLIASRAIALNNANNNAGKNVPGGKAKKGAVIPYRESLLTYVLSDNLGGNSFTVMCANVSPCAASAGETESTLRYATLAKNVVNHAKLNETPTARVIREMRDQLRVMQEALRSAPDPSHVAELEVGVQLSEELLREMKGREENYEAQLHEQEKQAETLRQAVEAYKKQEAYWREEAQRQQREVEELREALFEATQNNRNTTTTAKSSTGATATKGDSGAERSFSKSLHLPQLGTLKSSSATELASGTSNNNANAAAMGEQKAQKPRKSLPNSDRDVVVDDNDLLSPASRDWKPTRKRGTPLSLMGIRGKQRGSRTSMPTLPVAPASAPEKGSTPRDGGGFGGGGGVSRVRRSSGGGFVTPTAFSPAPPRSPSLKKQSITALALRPPLSKLPATQKKKNGNPLMKQIGKAEESAETGAERNTSSVAFSTMGPRDGEVQRAGEHETVERLSFYPTAQYLTNAVGASVNLDGQGNSTDDTTPTAAHRCSSTNGQPKHLYSSQDRQTTELNGLLDVQQLQEQIEALRRNSNEFGGNGDLEIEGVAATSSKQQSPRVAAVRQAQAARDRRRSSSLAANAAAVSAASKKFKKKSVQKTVPRDEAPVKDIGNNQSKLPDDYALLEQAENGGGDYDADVNSEGVNDDNDDSSNDLQNLAARFSHSPHGDEGLTDMLSADLEYRDEENTPTNGVLVNGDVEDDAVFTTTAANWMQRHFGDNGATEKVEKQCDSPEALRQERPFHSPSDVSLIKPCAGGTARVSPSSNRTKKPSDGDPQSLRKTQRIRKKSIESKVTKHDTPVGGCHYSTVDMLL